MPLSEETIANIEAAKAAIEEYRDLRLAEIDAQAERLKAYDTALAAVSERTTTPAVDNALSLLSTLLA